MDLRSLVESAHDSAGRVGMREEGSRVGMRENLASAPASRRRSRFFFPPWQPGRPGRAVPPAKGLDEACAWLHKAALTPFPTDH